MALNDNDGGANVVVASFINKLSSSTDLISCKCHEDMVNLFFPAYVLFASESSKKCLIKAMMMDILYIKYHKHQQQQNDDHLHDRYRYVDVHHLLTLIVDSLTDHFLICNNTVDL